MSSAFPIITPDLKEYMDLRKRDLKSELNCCSIGTIQGFDSSNQTATIQINFLREVRGAVASTTDNPDGIVKLSYPLLVKCPVMILSGGTARLTFPIAVGDTCMVLFCDKDMDTWFTTGQINVPNSPRTHDLNDAIAIIGIRSEINKLTDYSNGCELKWPDGIISVNDKTGERLTQAGMMMPYAGSSAPSGWLLCYGQSISKTTYANLFDVIGYTYGGSGDNFNVPDMRGRAFIGLDNIGGTNANVLTNAITPNRNTLGGATGQETINIQHNHGGTATPITQGSPGSASNGVNIGDQHREQYATIANDLSPTQTIMQPSRLGNWLIKY
ncbi:tail fiber protein [Candidatus Dependentiae bacterium]|nr:MAG: tail fiber protein [Candidatus Dependentiae bacterium]